MDRKKAALYNALAWINSMKNDDGIDSENVDVGVQCLSEAFGIKLQDAEQQQQYQVQGASPFEDIFHAGINKLDVQIGSSAGSSSVDQDPVVSKNPDLWKKWVSKLESKGFFKDAPTGSQEYNNRLTKALGKFKEKFGDVHPPTEMSKKDKEAKAEHVKADGNAALAAGNHARAAELYTEALSLSPDGPNSHIYHSNLAAALTYLGKYEEVVEHCEQSIQLNANYVKAYSRMGNARLHLEDYDGAIDAFRRGLEVDPNNAACRDGLADAERKMQSSGSTAATSSAPAGGMPDLSSLAGMLGGGGGGGGGLGDLLNNPQMQQMAQNMMQNPQMMQMAQNMMQNPDMLRNMMSGMGNGGGSGGGAPGAGAGGMPDMSSMMNSPEIANARQDPELQDFFRDIDSEGPSAATRHMSNPKVMQLLQSITQRMQG